MKQQGQSIKQYKDKIIHFFGSMHQYVGEFDQGVHKNGPGWYRILNPCVVMQQHDPETKILTNILMSLTGPGDAYKKYVDIRVPDDFVVEIRTVNKKGAMYEFYKGETDRKPRAKRQDGSNLIEIPGLSGVPTGES